MNQQIELKDAFNVRDLGGYPAKHGQTVKCHRLIRGSYLSELEPADQQKLLDYGIRTVIDLRTPQEAHEYPDRLPTGITYLSIPILRQQFGDDFVKKQVFLGNVPNARAGYQHMLRLYCRLIISPLAQDAYHRFLSAVANAGQQGGVLFHCSTGKDRTGIATIMLLHLLGVPATAIQADYLLSNRWMATRINRRIGATRLKCSSPAYLKAIFDVSTVQPAYYQLVMATISYLYGGMDSYLTHQVKVSQGLASQLRKQFLIY